MATIQINAEQAKVIANLSIARQAVKDAQQAEKIAKEQIESWGTEIGDVLTLNGLTVAKIVQGTRTDLDRDQRTMAEAVKFRGTWRQWRAASSRCRRSRSSSGSPSATAAACT